MDLGRTMDKESTMDLGLTMDTDTTTESATTDKILVNVQNNRLLSAIQLH
jgi:hypothetical protein